MKMWMMMMMRNGQKRFSTWQPFAILNFKTFHIRSRLSSSAKSAVVHHVSSKSDDFSLRYGDLTILKMSAVAILNFTGPRIDSL